MKNTSTHYGALSRALHWLIAIAIFGLMLVGSYMEGLPDDHAQRGAIYGLHKATGAVVLALVVIRVLWLTISPAPKLPDAISAGEQKLAKIVKHLMYMLMLAVPLSGLLMSTYFGSPVSIYGLFELPLFVEKNQEMAGIFHAIHGTSVTLLFGCIVLHIAGVIKHRRSGNPEEDVIPRMWG